MIDLTGYTRSISELLALFHVARLLVTNDGGPGQFAALTPIWTLMLFGPETPAPVRAADAAAAIRSTASGRARPA